MVEYGVLVSLTLMVHLFFERISLRKNSITKITIAVFFLGYFFLLCTRDISVGVDTMGYVKTYRMLSGMYFESMFNYSQLEGGFVCLEAFLSFLGGGERVLLCVVATLIVFPVMYLYQHEAEEPLICISFFLISLLFEMFFSGMRQSIAIACCVPAFYFAKRRQLIPFLLMIGLACSFHMSAVVAIAIYPVYHAKITKKWLWFIIPAFAGIYFFRDTLLTYFFLLAGDEYSYRYAYLNSESSQVGLMILFLLLSVYSYVMTDDKLMTDEDRGLRNILLLAAGVHLFTPLNPVISRINYYFILFIPLILSRIPSKCYAISKPVANLANIVMIFFFIFYFFCLKSDSLHVFPYKFFA